MKNLLLSILIIFTSLFAYSTHNRAGEITFRKLDGLRYEFTIVTYTKTSAIADRPELEIIFSDGTSYVVSRTNITPIPNRDIQRNTYVGEHIFAGPGEFKFSVTDPNRNQGIINLGGSISVDIPFYIESEVVIFPFSGYNNSPILLNPPIDDACKGIPWIHNPGATDPEGDSLVYELVPCKSGQDDVIPTYFTPPGMSINSQSGTITWNSPTVEGEFNIAILIKEYRNGNFMGSVLRDMQIRVISCEINKNNPPQIEVEEDTCVDVESLLKLRVKTWDPDGDNVTLYAFGEPSIAQPLTTNLRSLGTNGDTTFYDFEWDVKCQHLRKNDYTAYFRAVDDSRYLLTNIAVTNIKLAGPPPENPEAIPSGNSINLVWDKSTCTDLSGIGYKIYKKQNFTGWTPSSCETGVPGYTGYALIGEINDINDTTFTDNENLSVGIQYCYMVTVVYEGDFEGYATFEFCTQLAREVPLMTHVDIFETSTTIGKDTVQWSKPTELDTAVQHTGPYKYALYRKDYYDDNDPFVKITEIGPSSFIYTLDTVYVDTLLNTANVAYEYKVELISGTNSVGVSASASSIYTTGIPNDNQIELMWDEEVPWSNQSYNIYKSNSLNGVYTFIENVTTPYYLDTGLINGVNYCYYVESIGDYSSPGIVSPIINKSQKVCYEPIDLWPPCAPTLDVTAGCDDFENTLVWNNPNNSCSDDAVQYDVYFSSTRGGRMEKIYITGDMDDTTFTHFNENVAGCYAVSAMDTFGNESVKSNIVCIDNCPEFIIPNVFTPNGDGVNDLLISVENKFIEKVYFTVYNRWGNLVYSTTDTRLNWNGVVVGTFGKKELLSDGVYYYYCDIQIKSVDGIKIESQQGTITIMGGDPSSVND